MAGLRKVILFPGFNRDALGAAVSSLLHVSVRLSVPLTLSAGTLTITSGLAALATVRVPLDRWFTFKFRNRCLNLVSNMAMIVALVQEYM